MANVLPPHDRNALRTSYWLRLFVVFACMVVGAMAVGIAALAPAYILARVELNEVEQYRELQDQTREVAKSDTAVQTARLVNTQIEQLLYTEKVRPSRAIEHLMRDWERHADDIIIASMAFSLLPEKKTFTPELRISGEARNRAALNDFVQTLRADPTFTEVSFSVAALIGEGIIDFSLAVKFKS